MTLQYSTAVRNAKLDAIETAIGTSPKLRIYTGAAPANCAAARTGSILAEVTCPSDWLAAASSGSKALSGSWTVTASGTGTAAHFSLMDNAGTTCHAQGTVGTSGTDMIVTNTSFASGQTFTVTTFTITDNNA